VPPRDAFFAAFDSPIGRFWLAGGSSGLLFVTRSETPDALLSELARRGLAGTPEPAPLSEPMEWLRAYFSGERAASAPRIDWRAASAFDSAVYRAAMAIPYGTTASYAEVAAAVGSPRAARAVGGAMARCPFFPIVPCHRVIHADGSIGGWGRDLWVKRWLLDHEQRLGRAPAATPPA
jgi:methylated-DNA-[protein]-cysteine S-methyltransferase